jgi:hypothetical protein
MSASNTNITRYSDYDDGLSDSESFRDELSPTDGYFSHRQHPQHVFVEQGTDEDSAGPTVSFGAKSDQRRQAVSENQLPSGQAANVNTSNRRFQYQSVASPRFSSSPFVFNERTPLLNSFEQPPPSYSDATMGQPYEYRAVDQDDLPEARDERTLSREGLLSFERRRDPVSIGEPDEEGLYDVPLTRRRKHGWRRYCSKQKCIGASLGTVVAVVLVTLIATLSTPTNNVITKVGFNFFLSLTIFALFDVEEAPLHLCYDRRCMIDG